MNIKHGLLGLICCSAASLLLADTHIGIGVSIGVPPPVHVRRAPPPRHVERVIIASPGPGFVWVPGHYTWAGNQWIWMSGAWVLPPAPGAYWVDGSWDPAAQQWIAAHWVVPTAVVTPTPPPPVVVQTPAPVAAAPAPVTEIVVQEAPPPPPVQEVRVVAPGPEYVWISGYWGWEHGRREWFAGHWERPPHGYRYWVAPRWERRPHGYVFIRGYWM